MRLSHCTLLLLTCCCTVIATGTDLAALGSSGAGEVEPDLGVSSSSSASAVTVTQLERHYWSDKQCNTSSSSLYRTTLTPAGACARQGAHFHAHFCSLDGATVYDYTYADDTCSIPLSVAAHAASCSRAQSVRCLQPRSGPSSPFPFPPPNWATVTSCYNQSVLNEAIDSCDDDTLDPAVGCAVVAYAPAVCLPSSTGSSAFYCDQQLAGSLDYADSNCSSAVQSASLRFFGCYAGSFWTCPEGAPSMPLLPNLTQTLYSDELCSPSAAVAMNRFTSGCSAMGDTQCNADMFTQTRFLGPSSCEAAHQRSPGVAFERQVGVCVEDILQPTLRTKFFCN